jgi:hypothetical protein
MIAGSRLMSDVAPQTVEARFEGDFATATAKDGGYFRRCIARFLSQFQVPVGFEDKAGFHFGVESSAHEADELCCLK